MKPKKTIKNTELNLGGIPYPLVCLCAGFCVGLSVTKRFSFDESERKILKSAGLALRAAGMQLYKQSRPDR